MPKEIKPQRVMVIAGKCYPLKYGIEDREAIETELDKSCWDAITSGRLRDQVVLIRVGVAHKYPNLKDASIRKRLQDHLDEGSPLDVVVRTAFWAVFEAGLVGSINDIAKLRKAIPDPELDKPDDDDEDAPAGKDDAPAAVPARNGI